MARYILTILLLLGFRGEAQDLQSASTALANSDVLKNGRFAFYALDLNSNEVLVSQEVDALMVPASTLKLLTTYAAMDVLGPEHRFTTELGYTGSIDESGVLHGDVVIKGEGDPALGSEHFLVEYGNGTPIERQMAVAIHKAGVKSIKGRIVMDDSYYSGPDIPMDWSWQDIGNYYAAGAHAFTFHDNLFELSFNSPSVAGLGTKLAKVQYDMPWLKIENHVQSSDVRSDQAYVYSSPFSDRMEVWGEIPKGRSDFLVKAAIPDPSRLFIALMKDQLSKFDIEVIGESMDYLSIRDDQGAIMVEEILVLESPKLSKIIAHTNLHSSNLYAEHLLRQVGKTLTGESSFESSLKGLGEWISDKGINSNGLRLRDGSGLSKSNAITARFMMDLLSSMYTEPYFEEIKMGLPVAGLSGSMSRIGKGTAIEGRMFAKTGYINGARAYSGFLEEEDSTIGFCIMANDYSISASAMRKKLAELMVLLTK